MFKKNEVKLVSTMQRRTNYFMPMPNPGKYLPIPAGSILSPKFYRLYVETHRLELHEAPEDDVLSHKAGQNKQRGDEVGCKTYQKLTEN